MTGVEAAVVGVAASAAKGGLKSVREQRREEQKVLLEAAKQTPEFQKAARIKGNKLAVKEALGLILMKPLAGIMGVSREYFETEFGEDYAEKIADVPEANLQTPKASIAGPAFEGLGYSLEEPKLKEMYLELLARASDDRVAATAHPSFVQIIRDLTTEEAIYLPRFLGSENLMTPIVELRSKFIPTNGHRAERPHVLDIRNEQGNIVYDPMVPTYVDNWVRLNLVGVDYSTNMTRADAYDWQAARPERDKVQARIDENLANPAFQRIMAERGVSTVELDWRKGIMTATPFGFQFAKAVGMIS